MLRTYEQTHPWISFKSDLRRASYTLWMLLGEAASKCEHVAGVPLRPSVASDLHKLYLAKGALATTAIEGNTLTEEQVLLRLEGKGALPLSQKYLGDEVDNIVKSCNRISLELSTHGDRDITIADIKDFNREVLHGIPCDEEVTPGEIRTYSVGVGSYRGAPAEDCEYLLTRLCEWLASDDFKGLDGQRTMFSLLKATIAHLYIAWIHPFGDGNGRTARLVEFRILLSAGVPSPAAHLLSNHYNLTRSEYYRQLSKASKTGEVSPFIEYALQGFVDGLRDQLALIRNQQWDVVWRNYVHETFRDNETATGRRQRHLVLDLSSNDNDWRPITEIPGLSIRLSKAYSDKSLRTLNRDLNQLVAMNLIQRSKNNVRANKEVILAFLPWRKADSGE